MYYHFLFQIKINGMCQNFKELENIIDVTELSIQRSVLVSLMMVVIDILSNSLPFEQYVTTFLTVENTGWLVGWLFWV